MNLKWLFGIGVINLFAVLYAVGSFMLDFAILAPTKIQFEVGNPESVKAAIFQAQTSGIEMMRTSALRGGICLGAVMILNFAALYAVFLRQTKKS